jgi:hypothetical protein
MDTIELIYMQTCLNRVSVESNIGYWICPHWSWQDTSNSKIPSRKHHYDLNAIQTINQIKECHLINQYKICMYIIETLITST